jgi:quercetin dioxygenase-like cupin family protein
LADPTPDEAPPPHVHHGEDETFYVLDGVLRFVIGTEEFEAEPGALVHAPRGVPHRFTVATPTARILALVTPGGLEHFFATLADATDPDDMSLTSAAGGACFVALGRRVDRDGA